MTESNVRRRQKDRSKIDVNDPVDVRYVHYQFPWLSYKQIREAIRTFGPDRDAVEAALERSGTAAGSG